MATKRVSRAAKAPSSKQADWSPSCERAAATHFMAEQGQLSTVRRNYFCEADRHLPIAGTPAPEPCPFCGVTDVSIVFTDSDERSAAAHVECANCGAEAPYACEDPEDTTKRGSYWLAMEAARVWNTRGGAK